MAKPPNKQTTNKSKPLLLGIALFASFVVGGLIGKFAFTAKEQPNSEVIDNADDVTEMREGGYKYINPLLECDNYRPSKRAPVVLLEADLKNYINQTINSGNASIISVYFRDLNNGPWIGVNELENYSPASLLKVPIMMAVLKMAESQPGLLAKKILYKHPVDEFSQNILDTGMIVTGHYYSVEDLMYRMIKNSDNEAKNLLYEIIGDNLFGKVIKDLGLFIPGVVTENYMSVRDYSSFFRVLYNATYLNKEMSEKGLEILSNTNFQDGIIAGIPKGVIVSHKFGERGYKDSDIKQLHDCGIVYSGSGPYLLCVMTRGTDFKQQSNIIAHISSMIWESFTSSK